jgi:hypothetical protein
MFDRKTLMVFCAGAAAAATLSFAMQINLASAQTGANQPHMQAALASLTNARGELQAGATNKGGHRVNALNLVNQAIVEVQAGMAFAN